jgi:hypothetical protein
MGLVTVLGAADYGGIACGVSIPARALRRMAANDTIAVSR